MKTEVDRYFNRELDGTPSNDSTPELIAML